MNSGILVGIDAGTSVIKAVAFSVAGDVLATSSRKNEYNTLANGGVEQNMQRTWADTLAVLTDLITDNAGFAERILAIAVTGQGDGTWLIDAQGEPVHDAWLWLDSRAFEQASAIESLPAYRVIYNSTGTGVNVCQMRTHLRWMQEHAPDVLANAATSFHCKDYLYYKLTGVRASDPSEGVFTFGSLKTRDYDEAVIDALGLTPLRHLLPPIVDGIEQSFALSAELGKQLGLHPDVPVILGYVDVICSSLGGGLYDADVSPGLSIVGSTGMHMKWVESSDDITLNDQYSGYTMCFPGGSYTQMQSNMAATLNIDWMLDIACNAVSLAGFETTAASLLPKLDDAVEAAAPGCILYHPYISHAGERGPFTEPQARASFTGLDQSSSYADMLRAVFEGLAFASRDCFTAMGTLPDEIRLSGGAAQSRMLRTIIAAVLNRPVRVAECKEAGAAGACMMAATQLKLFPDLAACCDTWVNTRLGDLLMPDEQLSAHYDTLFPIYKDTREALQSNWELLSDVRKQLQHNA